MIDLLNLINKEKISEDEIYSIYEKVVSDFHEGLVGDIPDELGLDHYEWTAFCHGISWMTIASWRPAMKSQ